MRYLSQLARETTARVMPPRTPSWLQPIASFTQTTVVDADPSAPTRQSEPTAAFPAAITRPLTQGHVFDVHEERAAAQDNSAARKARDPVSTAAEGSKTSLPQTPYVAQPPDPPHLPVRSPPSEMRLAQPTEVVAIANHAHATPTPSAARPAHEATRAGESAAIHANGTATLQSVLNEIAQRQQELEERFRATRTVGLDARAREAPDPRSEQHHNTSETRLDIGSIVVQVAPEPGAAVAPQPAVRRATGATDRSWARLFLDR